MQESEVKELLRGIAEKNGDAIREQVQAQTQELSAAVQKQGEEMRKLQGVPTFGNDPARIIGEDQKKAIKGLVDGDRRSLKFTVPKTLVTRALISGSTLGHYVPGVGQLATAQPRMRSLFNAVPIGTGTGGVIRYFDQNAVTRGANTVLEGALKPESAISWIERSLPIQKIADSIPVTKEALTDIPFLEAEIRRLLETNLSLKEDEQLYSGDGVPPNLKGVYTSAPAFVGTPYADTVEAANLFDLIAVVAADIAINKGAKYAPDTVLLNPMNMLGLTIAKDSSGRYLLPPFSSGSGQNQSIMGLKIVPSSQVAVNTMVVGDFRFGTIYDLEGVTIEMGWIDKQFIHNQMTILAEERLALLIRIGDEGAFRKVTNITTALADLETP